MGELNIKSFVCLMTALIGAVSMSAPVRSMVGVKQTVMNAGSGESAPAAYWGLCFTAEEPNVVVNMSKTGNAPAVSLETSTDGKRWTSFDADGGTTPITLAEAGDLVYFRAGGNGNNRMASSTSAYRSFTATGYVSASGSIMSLLNATNSANVVLPNYTYSFASLFKANAYLLTPPELPATTIREYCYMDMFKACTALTRAPALPCTSLALGCYNGMFNGCTGMTTAMEILPASIVVWNGYKNMFTGCSSMTNAPALPATSATGNAAHYYEMFKGCSALQHSPDIALQTGIVNDTFYSMFRDCKALRTPPPILYPSTAAYERMFSGCESLTSCPVICATNFLRVGMNGMFYGCKSLTKGPKLLFKSLIAYSLSSAFGNCSSLEEIEVMFTDWGVSTSTQSWLQNVKAIGTFRCPTALGTNTTIERGINRCPQGWTVVNTD